MLCERCGEREATVHHTGVSGGKVQDEVHLCEQCAQEIGVSVQNVGSISGWLAQGLLFHAPGVGPRATELRCEHCGLTFAEFRKSGLMGCAACYEAFEERLTPLLERAHEGGNQHRGKVPRRALSSSRMRRAGHDIDEAPSLAERIESLRRALDEAVRAEAYEKAARIRDELYGLTGTGRGEGGEP